MDEILSLILSAMNLHTSSHWRSNYTLDVVVCWDSQYVWCWVVQWCCCRVSSGEIRSTTEPMDVRCADGNSSQAPWRCCLSQHDLCGRRPGRCNGTEQCWAIQSTDQRMAAGRCYDFSTKWSTCCIMLNHFNVHYVLKLVITLALKFRHRYFTL